MSHTEGSINSIIDHLFRQEAGKMVSVLTRIFGVDNLELAEDVVQDALIEAVSVWQYKGIPDNPSAWLFRVAKNKAINIINRAKYKRKYETDMADYLRSGWTAEPALDILFSDQEIIDDQLRMIFTCCHPAISAYSQVALALKTLCGFSIPEIAKAFLSTEENINKRLVRARQKIRDDKIPFEVPVGDELDKRVKAVLETIYLLFNEGYSASKGNDIVRFELCQEAMRLVGMLELHPTLQRRSDVYALLALMQFNASRLKARQDKDGNLLTMAEQDRSLWDKELIQKGIDNLEKSASYDELSIYNIMAAISVCHCLAPDFASTDWKSILVLYDSLVLLDDSPVVLLNRAVALSKVKGTDEALQVIAQLKNIPSMKTYYLLYSTEAEFYMQLSQYVEAANSLELAIEYASMHVEKDLLNKRLSECKQKIV